MDSVHPHLAPTFTKCAISQVELKGDGPHIIINFMRAFRLAQIEEKIPLRWGSGLPYFVILHISASVLARHEHRYRAKVS